MLTFCRVCNPEHHTVGGDRRSTNSGSVENEDVMTDQSRRLRKDQKAHRTDGRTEEHVNGLKNEYRTCKRASTVLVECVNSCLQTLCDILNMHLAWNRRKSLGWVGCGRGGRHL